MLNPVPISPDMLAVIKTELLNDPAKRGYPGKTPDEQAALINAPFSVETSPATTLKDQPFKWHRARGVAQSVGEWPRVVRMSEMRLPAGTPFDDPGWQVIDAAINAVATDLEQIIDPTDAPAWAAFQGGLPLFVANNVLSQSTADTIMKLSIADVPAIVTEQHARIMEIFIVAEQGGKDFTQFDDKGEPVAGAPNEISGADVTAALGA